MKYSVEAQQQSIVMKHNTASNEMASYISLAIVMKHDDEAQR